MTRGYGSVMEFERHLGYTFNDPTLLRQALTHRSHANEQQERVADNERLEFLGDALLDLLVSEELFRRFPDEPEGVLSRMRAAIVNEGALARHARRLGVGGALFLGRGEERSGGREKDSLLADAFEALVAALYLDGGMSSIRRFMETHFFPYIDYQGIVLGGDYKTMLQERLQAMSRTALYRTVEVSGPDHAPRYCVEVTDGETLLGSGVGSSRKGAEQNAAREALSRLNETGGR